ncbi:hypothetical protein ACFV6F_02405 [Kitasatospora phosalacinea]
MQPGQRARGPGNRDFLYFYPIFTGQTIPMDDWRARMWLDTWI